MSAHRFTRLPPPRGALRLKEWLGREAQRHGIQPNSVLNRLLRDQRFYYPRIRLHRVNARMVFVIEQGVTA